MSYFIIADENNYKYFGSAQDHKRVGKNDLGANTIYKQKIKRAGYLVRVRYQEKEDPPLKLNEVRIIKIYNRKYLFTKGEVMMDCFVATRMDEQYVWSCGGLNHYTKKGVPARFYDTIDDLIFNGKHYFIPSNVEDYLTFRYGDWKTPQEKWDYRKDDGAIIYSRIVAEQQEGSH